MILALLSMVAWLPAQNAAAQEPVPLEIQFVGRETLSEGALRKAAELELDAFRRKGQQPSALDDAAFLMEEAYRAEGFPDVEVDWQLEQAPPQYLARFLIQEGKPLLLGALTFPGATALTPEQLAGLIGVSPEGTSKSPFRRSQLQGLPSAIQEAYWQLGYLETKVSAPEYLEQRAEQRRGARLVIEEGTGYVLRNISFLDAGPLGEEACQEVASSLVGLPYFPRRQVELAQRLRFLYARAAYPETKVHLVESRDRKTGDVLLAVTIEPGAATTYSEIVVEGVERTNPDFVRQRLGMEVGEAYDREKLDDAFVRLFRTGLFRTIKMDLGPGAQGPEERPLIVTVEESLAKELSFRSGYGSYEGIRIGTSFVERNLFGTGRRFRSSLDASQVGWAAEIGWTDPWLLGSEISLDLPVYIRRRQEPSFTREELGFGWNLQREFTPRWNLSGGWSFRRSNVSAVTVLTSSEVIAEDVNISSFFTQPEYDSRNDLFNPTAGSLARVRFEWAGDHFLGGEAAFLRSRVDLSRLISLTREQDRVLGFAWSAGLAWPLGSTERLPLQERFFNGGEDSVRSFREGELGPLDINIEPLGGESFHTASVELRQKVKNNLWASAFVDAGNVGLRADDIFGDLRWGVGTGLRYLLPVGALRLDMAWNPDRRRGEPSYQVFLTVGMSF